MKLLAVCVIVFLGCITSVNAQIYKIFEQPRENHIPFIAMMYDLNLDSLSMVQLTDSLLTETTRLREDKEKLYVELSHANMINYYNEKRVQSPSILLSTRQKFVSSPYPEITLNYYFSLAESYTRLKKVEEAFHYYYRLEDMLTHLDIEKLSMTAIFMSGLSQFYAQFQDYKSAAKYAQLGMKYKNPLLFKRQSTFLYNNLGYYLAKTGQYDEAEKMYYEAIKASKNDQQNDYEGIGASNLGNLMRIRGKYKEALPFLYKDIQINENQVKENAATSCLYLADCLIQLDSIEKAKTYIDKAKILASQSYYQSSFLPTYYEVSSLYYKKTGNYPLSLKMQDSLLLLKDSIKKVYDANLLRTTFLKEKEAKFLEKENQIQSKTKNKIRSRNILIAGITLIFLAILYFLKQHFKKEKLKAQQKEIEAMQAIKLANENLQNFLLQIQEKNKIIEQYQQLNPVQQEQQENLPFVQNLLQSVILTEEDWVKFKEMFNQAYPSFLTKLHQEYPNLSPAELRLVVLQQLPISTKHQASMIGISAASLRTAKYRLRKKHPELLNDEELLNE